MKKLRIWCDVNETEQNFKKELSFFLQTVTLRLRQVLRQKG